MPIIMGAIFVFLKGVDGAADEAGIGGMYAGTDACTGGGSIRVALRDTATVAPGWVFDHIVHLVRYAHPVKLRRRV